jgi:hypothetical protein
MINKLKYSLTVIITTLVFFANAQQTVKITPSGIGYLEYLPQGYNSNNNNYPLVISLHGIKERGTSSTDPALIKAAVPTVANVGLPKYVKYGQQYPFILISPQLHNSYGNWPAAYVMEVLNYVKKYLRVNTNRIYLTGLSLGGGGVWVTAGANPNVFAAIAPLCGSRNDIPEAPDMAAADLPVWGMHGDKDTVVPYKTTVNMVNAINGSAPRPAPLSKLTIFPGMGHMIWDKAYKETSLINWMLSYTKGSSSGSTTSNVAPVASAGADITKTLPVSGFNIVGSGKDSDGTIASYSWTQASGPNTATLSGKTSATLNVSNLVAGTYSFALKVTDNDGATDTDNVSVVVNSTSTTNISPIVSAGADRTIVLPLNSVYFQASASDKDGSIVSYTWTKTSGGSCSLSGNTTSRVRAYRLYAGTYTFKVTVKDNKGATTSDYVTVIVKPVGTIASVTTSDNTNTVLASANTQQEPITTFDNISRW